MKNQLTRTLLSSALMIIACCIQQVVYSQNRIIKGKVTDSKNQALPDVSVMIKGANKGTFTNREGQFQISGAKEQETLVISILGYQSKEVVSKGAANVFVNLSDSSSILNEVVVVGYGTEKKTSLTGAVVTVKGEQLEMIPTSALSNTLAGRVPGATVVNNSGFAGAPSTIQIRGIGTTGNTTPLYVIDGIVQPKAFFDALNPAEVESINILKDAATASVYGSRGANGV
ncbi:MAG: carboxypeptidase-like regulatory domain-containing protein, partial [Chitinophagaceae bacterium]